MFPGCLTLWVDDESGLLVVIIHLRLYCRERCCEYAWSDVIFGDGRLETTQGDVPTTALTKDMTLCE